MSSEALKNIGRYQLQRTVGAFNGRESYLASDPLFDRLVVLQLIPLRQSFADANVLRCREEVQAIAKLNHSNIARVFDMSEIDNYFVIVTEYIEGRSLDLLLKEKTFQLPQVLDVALQLTTALVAAHQIGIKHGHIRPEVVFLQPDGTVKLVDFGLSCLHQDQQLPTTLGYENTQTTINQIPAETYLPPEYDKGLNLDFRADLWGVGSVLYEMLAGAPPPAIAKTGELSSAVVNSAMLAANDRPLQRLATELELVVRKALNPDREERYQTAKEMLGDLRHLQKSLEHTYTPESITRILPTDGRRNETRSRELFRSITNAPQHRRTIYTLALMASLLAIPAFYLIKKNGQSNIQTSNLVAQRMKITRLTSVGNAREAAISADGKNVAYVVSEDGRQSLWLRMVDAVSNRRIMPPTDGIFYKLSFSRDGNYLTYMLRSPTAPVAFYQLPILGGTQQRLIENAPDTIKASPDNKTYAYLRRTLDGETSLMVGDPSVENGSKILSNRKSPDFISSLGWAPDGQSIICSIGRFEGGLGMSVISVDVNTGAETLLSPQTWGYVRQLEWLPDASGVLVLASDQALGSYQIWQIALPGGQVSRITNDLYNYGRISVSADATTIATDASNVNSSMWLANLSEQSGPSRRITKGEGANTDYWGMSLAPDKKLYYESTASGSQDLWLLEMDGGEPKQLTSKAGNNFDPSVSPDGRYIVFASTRGGTANIWRIDADGTGAKQITKGKSDNVPYFSPDGKTVVYASFVSNIQTLWKVSVEGGDSVQLLNGEASWPSVSPDGKTIACWYRKQPGASMQLAIVPFAGGDPIKTFDLGPSVSTGAEIRWMPEGRSLAYIDTQNGVSNIILQPIDGGPTRRLTSFTENQIYRFDLSRDGKQLAYSRGMGSSDIVLIRNFK